MVCINYLQKPVESLLQDNKDNGQKWFSILGKSVTLKMLFTYINHESRRLSRKTFICKI